MAECSLSTLLDQACESGFRCLDEKTFRGVLLQLICDFQASGGGGGGTGSGNLTAGSAKVSIGGTGAGATFLNVSVDVVEANLTLDNIGGTLGATKGGTGQVAVTTGDLLYGSAPNTWSKLADVATGNALISGGVGVAPSWGKIALTTHVSGILPVANGGTGTSTAFTLGSVIFAGAAGVFTQDNANFFWDDTNNRLGLGNVTPAEALEITGNLRFTSGANRTIAVTDATSGAGNSLILQTAAGVGDSGSGGNLTATLGAAGNRATTGNAANAGSLVIIGAAGGSSTIGGGFSNAGGTGGAFSFTGGVGGAAANGGAGATSAGSGGGFAVVTGAGGVVTTLGAGSNGNGSGGAITFTTGGGGSGVAIVLPGGASGSINFICGAGAAGGLGFSGGNGGTITFTRGAGGASAQSGAGTNTGGNASSVTFGAAAGGSASGATTANVGGNGGDFTLAGSTGGNTSGASGTNTGGTGGSVLISAGNGGNGLGATANVAGTPGSISFTAGNGGSVTSGGTGKAGGNLNLTAGNGTNVAGVTNNGGNIYLLPGAKSPSGSDGNVFLGVNSAGTIRGNVAVGLTAPTARLHLPAGTATASTAPLKFNSGTLLTTAEAGAVEFLTDDFYGTITTGAARKKFVLDDGAALTSGRVPFATTNGRLSDDADFTFATDTLTVTKLSLTTGFVSDVKLTTAGLGVYIKEGANATMGTATLIGGTIVVNTTKVTSNSRIFLTINGGTITNVGAVYISARTAGTSFTITSLNALDTSDVAWVIVEPA